MRRPAAARQPARREAVQREVAPPAEVPVPPAGYGPPGQRALDAAIQQSPRMAAQRRQLQRSFGGAGAPPVQAKMGFELETENRADKWQGGRWRPYGRNKDHPIYKGEGFDVETDTHFNPEFIFPPQESKAPLMAAADAAADFCTEMNEAYDRKKGAYGDTRKADSYLGEGEGWQGDFRLHVNDTSWKADGQATLGVRLRDIPAYIRHVVPTAENEALQDMMDTVHDAERDPAVQGLLTLMIKFVADFQEWVGEHNEEGPKNAQAYMNRNSFDKMLASMGGGQRAAFRALFYDGGHWKADNPITTATGVDGDTRVIPNVYLGRTGAGHGHGRLNNMTTLKTWVDSVLQLPAEEATDLMSPPQGWRGGNYGMGLMDMDTESVEGTSLALFEYRKTDNREELDDWSGKDLSFAEWSSWMEERFDKAREWNDTLREDEAQPDGEQGGDGGGGGGEQAAEGGEGGGA